MRVARNYYNEANFHRPEIVESIVDWCNTYINECKKKNDVYSARIAHQLKCLVIKRYSRNSGPAFIPLCEDWEQYPLNAVWFLWEYKLREPRRIDIIKGAKEISPTTII